VDRNGIFEQRGEGVFDHAEAPIRLPMNADEARDLKPNLRIAIVCTVTHPSHIYQYSGELQTGAVHCDQSRPGLGF
jgi:hypothetical protein